MVQGTRDAYVKSLIRRRYADLAANPHTATDGRARALVAGYQSSSLERVPEPLVRLWSGCGPLAEDINLDGVETIVDIGCGGGLDAWLLATRPTPPRHIIAVDLTPEMLVKLGQRLPPASSCRISMLAGDGEHLPLADGCCDLVVANAALNLALDMPAAIAEAARVLRPGGRLQACEPVREGELAPEILADPLGHATSLGGVATEGQLREAMTTAGLVDVLIDQRRPFPPVFAITIRARKPISG